MAASSPSRRAFIHSSAVAGAATLALPAIQAAKASEKLNIGIIGCGIRGTQLTREVIKLKHNVVAICDIAEFRLEELQKVIALTGQDEKATQYFDFRRLLNHKSLDAVVITSTTRGPSAGHERP